MTLIERVTDVWEDEKQTKKVQVRSWELSGVPLPKEKNLPVVLHLSWCRPVYLCCSHQDADIFLAFPISFWGYVKLWWYRLWH